MAQPEILPLPFAPAALTAAVFGAGVLSTIAVMLAARWAARLTRTARMVAEVGGQLVAIRAPGGQLWTAVGVPQRLTSLFTSSPRTGDVLPPWVPEVAVAIEALVQRVTESPIQPATVECEVDGRRLRVVGVNVDGQLHVSIGEAGLDAARVNRFESAALLSSGVLHDLRNVLGRLALHADVGYMRATDAEAVQKHFERIRAGAHRAAEIAALMSRYLRGQLTAGEEVAPVRVEPVVDEVIELLRPGLPRGIELVTSHVDPEAMVRAEEVHLHQIILNLVHNAAQALEGRAAPQIAITVARTAGRAGEAPCVTLAVADNGPGVPPALRERCFDAYVTTKRAAGGTGLGLAVVRTLVVETLGGAVVVDETPGGGARFTVTLPDATPRPRATRSNTDEYEVPVGR